MNLKETAKNIKKNITAIFVAMQKKETPWYAKVIAVITVGYALSPIDFIPDFIPMLGYLDDVIILPVLIILSIKLIPESIFKQSQIEAEDIWKNGKPQKWYYAAPIVLVWVLCVYLMIRVFLK